MAPAVQHASTSSFTWPAGSSQNGKGSESFATRAVLATQKSAQADLCAAISATCLLCVTCYFTLPHCLLLMFCFLYVVQIQFLSIRYMVGRPVAAALLSLLAALGPSLEGTVTSFVQVSRASCYNFVHQMPYVVFFVMLSTCG
jgi:hypothetical protein